MSIVKEFEEHISLNPELQENIEDARSLNQDEIAQVSGGASEQAGGGSAGSGSSGAGIVPENEQKTFNFRKL